MPGWDRAPQLMAALETEDEPGAANAQRKGLEQGAPAAAADLPASRAWAWFVDNHLLVFLAVAFAVGLSLPAAGRLVSEPQADLGFLGRARVVELLCLVTIFFIAGFRLKTDAVVGALRSPKALIVAMVLILAVTPCVGFVAVSLPLPTKEISHGLAVFCCVPTTLTSGAALVSGCRGTERATELALMVTVATNLLGSITTPLMLSLVMSDAEVSIDAMQLLAKLVVSILVPTLVGKAVQDVSPGGAAFSKHRKVPLTIFSNFALCFVVWMSVSRSQGDIVAQPASQVAACIACGVVLHFVFWLVAAPVVLCAQIQDLHHSRAVFLLAAQKTLPVSVTVIASLPESFGEAGLIALPCIFGHLSQLVVDSLLVRKWAQQPNQALVALCTPAEQVAPLEKD